MAGPGQIRAASGLFAAVLAIASFGCAPKPDYLGDAERAFNSHRKEFQMALAIIRAHPEIRWYQGGGWLIPDRDIVGHLHPNATSYKDYKKIADLLKVSGIDAANTMFVEALNANRPHFAVDFSLYCTGWHRGSECAEVTYDELLDWSRARTPDAKCIAVSVPHWYACDER